mgnify:CR=1 FL=1
MSNKIKGHQNGRFKIRGHQNGRFKKLIVQYVNRNVRWALIALAVYTLTTLVMMYPVPFRLNSVIVGEEGGDAYRYAWTLWWAKQTAFNPGLDLAHLSLLNHPVGIELVFMLTGIAVNLQALPFSLLLPPAAAYNLQVLLAFILSGMAMYWFCLELTDDHKASLVGGFIFAFFPNKTGHVMAGHLPQVTVYWVPLHALFLWRALRRPTWRSGLLAGLTLAPACLVHVMHLPYLVLPVTVVVLLIALLKMRREFFTQQRLRTLALVYGIAALLIGPFLLPTILHFGEGSDYLYKEGTIASSADLLAFFTPSRYHPLLEPLGLLPSFAERVFPGLDTLREGLVYPGLLATALALWGLIYRRRSVWVWGALALVTAVLSLGPLLKVGGELPIYQVDGQQSYILLPYALFKQVPLMNIGRTPSRLNEASMFALAVLASYGAAKLLTGRRRLMALLPAALLLGIGFEYIAIWPILVSPAEIPPVIQSIAQEPGGGALLHLGMGRREVHHRALYYQTYAPRPCVGGRVHRTLPVVPPWLETFSRLSLPDSTIKDIVPRPDLAERTAWLRHLNVDYVLFHRRTWEWETPHYRDFVENLLGPPRHEDYALTAYPVPREIAALQSDQLYTFSREGWRPPEQDGDLWRRWMGEDGQLYLYSTNQETGRLRFTVDSHQKLPLLEIYLGDQALDSFRVNERTTYTTRSFTLTQGMNVFRFRAPDGCQPMVDNARCWGEALLTLPTKDEPIPCDPQAVRTTCRTFIFDHVSFVPQGKLPPCKGADINFGNVVRLRGWELDEVVLHPDDTLTVNLTWKAAVELSNQHVVFVHLLSPDGTLIAQHDAPPAEQLPSSTWPAGITFSYPVQIELPMDLQAGDYHLVTGIYLWPSMERLPADAPGAETGVIKLGPVEIEK